MQNLNFIKEKISFETISNIYERKKNLYAILILTIVFFSTFFIDFINVFSYKIILLAILAIYSLCFLFIFILSFHSLFLLLEDDNYEKFKCIGKKNINSILKNVKKYNKEDIFNYISRFFIIDDIIENFEDYYDYFKKENLLNQFMSIISDDFYKSIKNMSIKTDKLETFIINIADFKDINRLEYFFSIEEHLKVLTNFNDLKSNIINKNINHIFNSEKDDFNLLNNINQHFISNNNQSKYRVLVEALLNNSKDNFLNDLNKIKNF